MESAILEELTRTEWQLEETIVNELHKSISQGTLNLFSALHPNSLKGTVFYFIVFVFGLTF